MAYIGEKYKELYPQPGLDSAITKGRLIGKVAIVTGGSSGIGRAIVERFSNDGAAVAIFARNEERGEGVANELRAEGRNVKFYSVDVSDKERCVAAVKQVAEDNGGRVNFLVNSHALFKRESATPSENITDVPMEKFKQMLFVNVVGTANMVQACFPFMQTDGPNCAIVNISSIRAHNAAYRGSPYGAAKGAIHILTKCMALDLSRAGIRVNSVSPGMVWTPHIHKTRGDRQKAEESNRGLHMSPRSVIEAAGVASAVVFLCSKDAMYIDGADLPVDCGNLAMGPEGLGTV